MSKKYVTLGRFCALLYVGVVTVLTFAVIPGRDHSKHLTALRHLGPNTRLSEKLLIKPANVSIEESYSLERELRELTGKYTKQAVSLANAVTLNDVSNWPQVKAAEVFPVELQAEPDWVFLNQGSIVQVWVNNKPAPERAEVLAIVPSGSKWVALLKRADLKPETLAGAKDSHVLRLEVIAGEVVAALPSPSPSPSPSLSPSVQPTK